jgi:lysophospholipase L1-like esterase
MLVLLESELWQLKPDLVIAFENVNDLTANYFPGPTTPAYANKFLHNYYLPPELHRQEATLLDHSRCYTWACERLRRVIWYRLHYKETDEPIELKYAETYRANLRNICAVARAQGARVMLGTQAMAATQELFETQFKTKSYNADIVYPRVGQFREHFEAYNAIAREVAAEQKALFADPYTALKDRPELFIDVVHTRAGGARLVAREFADKLIASGWLDDLAKAKRRDTTPVAAQ